MKMSIVLNLMEAGKESPMSLSTVWSPGPNPPPTDQANHSQIPAARKPVCELIERLKQALKKRSLKTYGKTPPPT